MLCRRFHMFGRGWKSSSHVKASEGGANAWTGGDCEISKLSLTSPRAKRHVCMFRHTFQKVTATKEVKDALRGQIQHGAIWVWQRIPGPLAFLSVRRPSLKMTVRSYSCTICRRSGEGDEGASSTDKHNRNQGNGVFCQPHYCSRSPSAKTKWWWERE